jgi:hypothetical protein
VVPLFRSTESVQSREPLPALPTGALYIVLAKSVLGGSHQDYWIAVAAAGA